MILNCYVKFFWQLSRGSLIHLKLVWTQNTTQNGFIQQLSQSSIWLLCFCTKSILPISLAIMSSPTKSLHAVSFVFGKIEWQANSALFVANSVHGKPNFLIVRSNIQTYCLQNQSSSRKPSPKTVGCYQVVSSYYIRLSQVSHLDKMPFNKMCKGGKRKSDWLTETLSSDTISCWCERDTGNK